MKKISILLSVVAAVLLLCLNVSAEPDNKAFDYSAEKMECSIIPSAVDSEETERVADILGNVSASDWIIGPEDAALTIIEYADFQCPYCSGASLQLLNYQKKHSEDVRLVFRHFPLSFHEKAILAALAANAAGYQGMFFEAEQFLFETQDEWSGLENNEVFKEWLMGEFGKFSDLDFDLWYLAFSDRDNEADLHKQYSQVLSTGIVNGTPTVFLNYADSDYMFDDDSLDKLLESIRMKDKKYSECPDVVISEDDSYKAVLETGIGDIHIELFPDTAPEAVNNFIYLAGSGWFDGISFQNNEEGFMIRAGVSADPGYRIKNKYSEYRVADGTGYIGIQNSASGQNAGSFFITYDIPAYFETGIQQHIGDGDIPEEVIDQYLKDKAARFSKTNTLFGRVIVDDLEKLDHLKNGVVINRIEILP